MISLRKTEETRVLHDAIKLNVDELYFLVLSDGNKGDFILSGGTLDWLLRGSVVPVGLTSSYRKKVGGELM